MSLVPNQVSAVLVKSAVDNFVAIEFVTVVEKFASSPNAAANSFSVSNVVGAVSTKFAIAVSVYALAVVTASASAISVYDCAELKVVASAV